MLSSHVKIHSIFLFPFKRYQLFMLWSYSVSDTNYSFLGKIWRKAFNYSFTFHICINKHKKLESRNHWDSWDINSLAGGGGGDTKWTVTIWISKLWEISTQHSSAPTSTVLSEWQEDQINSLWWSTYYIKYTDTLLWQALVTIYGLLFI